MLNFIPNAFYKILRFSMIFLKKNFKFCPVQDGHYLISPLMLSLTVVNSFLKKCSYKQNIFGFHNIGHDKKIFRLLAKLIAFHLGFLVIPVWLFVFQLIILEIVLILVLFFKKNFI